jgi:hypothetical protein
MRTGARPTQQPVPWTPAAPAEDLRLPVFLVSVLLWSSAAVIVNALSCLSVERIMGAPPLSPGNARDEAQTAHGAERILTSRDCLWRLRHRSRSAVFAGAAGSPVPSGCRVRTSTCRAYVYQRYGRACFGQTGFRFQHHVSVKAAQRERRKGVGSTLTIVRRFSGARRSFRISGAPTTTRRCIWRSAIGIWLSCSSCSKKRGQTRTFVRESTTTKRLVRWRSRQGWARSPRYL